MWNSYMITLLPFPHNGAQGGVVGLGSPRMTLWSMHGHDSSFGCPSVLYMSLG